MNTIFGMRNAMFKTREGLLLILGNLKQGERLPSERLLSIRLGVSRMTLRDALQQLELESYISRHPRSGTYVTRPIIESELVLDSFTETMTKRGLEVSTRVLELKTISASKSLAATLMVKEQEPVFFTKRVRLSDNVPISIEELYISKEIVPRLSKSVLTGSLFKFLKEEYQITILRSDFRISAVMSTSKQEKLLELEQKMPLLSMKVIDADQNGNRFMQADCLYRADLYQLKLKSVLVNKP